MKACKKCGGNDRYPSGGCKKCEAESQRIKRIVNADSIKANRDKWREKNKEKLLAQGRVWKEANKEKMDEWQIQWNAANREKIRALCHKHRKFKVVQKKNFTAADVVRKFIEQQGACAYCGIDVVDDYHIDHIVPVSKGGANDVKNIHVVCPKCNRKKLAKLEADFLRDNPKVRVEKSVECVSGFFKSAGQKCVSLFAKVRGKSACQ